MSATETQPPPLAPTTAILAYCRAREALRAHSATVQQERSDASEARRALSGLLSEAMARDGLRCVEVPGTLHSTYVRLSAPTPRPRPITSEDAVGPLLAGVGDAVRHSPEADVPDVVARVVRDRLRATAGPVAPPRVSVVTKPPPEAVAGGDAPAGVTRLTAAPAEVRALTQQYVETCHEMRRTAAGAQPLRAAQRAAERAALEGMPPSVGVRVHADGKQTDVQLVRRRRKPRAPSLGVRAAVALCRDAARTVLGGPRDDFEARLLAEASRRVQEALAPAPAGTGPEYITVRRRPARASTG